MLARRHERKSGCGPWCHRHKSRAYNPGWQATGRDVVGELLGGFRLKCMQHDLMNRRSPWTSVTVSPPIPLGARKLEVMRFGWNG
jgi:hypothetical protein